jgi:hypothetical protein
MGGGAPLDQSHTGQGGSEAPVDSTEGVGDAWRARAGTGAVGRLRETGTARPRAWGVPTIETTMRIVEVPLILLLAPDTPIANESSP